MPEEPVHISGIGCISAIGTNVKENHSSLKEGSSGVGGISQLETVHRGEIPAAEIKASDEELMEIAGGEDPTLYSRTTLLGSIAAQEAWEHAGIGEADLSRTGLISATTTGGMRLTELYYRDYLANDSRNDFIPRHDCGDSTERIADQLGIKGYLTTINTACSSSANSIIFGTRLIRAGILDRVIVGGTDALSKFTLNGFNTLFILDREACKPFDNERKGLNLGEGSGFLVLEKESLLEKEGRKSLARVAGFGNSNDAYHQTASSPEGEGAYRAMEMAVRMNGGLEDGIDLVNVHGTGTPNNDLSEGRALQKLFGEGRIPPFSSTKSYTGHTLGASGGIEAVYSVLSLSEGEIFPALNFSQPMNELELYPRTEFQGGMEIRSVLSNSFGFGGNNSSLVLAKH